MQFILELKNLNKKRTHEIETINNYDIISIFKIASINLAETNFICSINYK